MFWFDVPDQWTPHEVDPRTPDTWDLLWPGAREKPCCEQSGLRDVKLWNFAWAYWELYQTFEEVTLLILGSSHSC